MIGGGERRSRCDSSGGFVSLSGAESSGASTSGSSVQLGWANKCLQKAVVRLCDGKQRRSALAYFKSTCANDSWGGLGACAVERGNFMAVLAFLDVSQLFVWVYDSEECAVGEAWRLGAEGARCLGALRWQSRRGHVQPGCALASFVELSLLTAPWMRSVVGAPKAKGRPHSKSKSEARLCESGWPCCVGVFCSRGWCQRACLRQWK